MVDSYRPSHIICGINHCELTTLKYIPHPLQSLIQAAGYTALPVGRYGTRDADYPCQSLHQNWHNPQLPSPPNMAYNHSYIHTMT